MYSNTTNFTGSISIYIATLLAPGQYMVRVISENMDEAIFKLSNTLAHSSPQAMAEMKKIFWKDTAHWDDLLIERAKISGKLVLSDFTKQAIEKFKKK